MKRTIVAAFCGIALLIGLAPVAAMAAKKPAKSQLAKARIHSRIKEALRNGTLTRTQAKHLKAEVKSLRADRKAAKVNGKLSPEDRAKFKAERQRVRGEIGGDTGAQAGARQSKKKN
jgi:hypothetical protein